MGAVGRARARGRGGRPRRALPLRPLPLDRARRARRLARRLGDARRRSPPSPSGIRLGTMVSPVTFRRRAGAREDRRDRRPHLRTGASSSGSAPAGTRPSTRPTGSRSRRRASASTSSTGSSPRSSASGPRRRRDPAEAATAAAAADHRRRHAPSRAPSAPPSHTPTSTTPSGRRSTRRASESASSTTAAREAGREPLRFSMMTGCVVGRDEAELRDRLGRVQGARRATTRHRSSGRSTRSPSACANTRPPASSARCSSTSSTRTSRWSPSWARSQPVYARRRASLPRAPRQGRAAPGEPDELRPLTTSGQAAARDARRAARGESTSTPSCRARCCAPARRPRRSRALPELELEVDERLAPGANLDAAARRGRRPRRDRRRRRPPARLQRDRARAHRADRVRSRPARSLELEL